MDYNALIEILACITAASFHFAAGTVVGFSAILIPQLEAQESDIKVDREDISWLASVVALVMPVSSLIAGFAADKVGRLNTIKTATVPYVAGWLCIAMAPDLKVLMIGRFLTGVSLSLACNPAVVYITEVARADFRGALICIAPSLTSLGMVITYAKGAFLHWRTIAWLSILYCVFPLVFLSLWTPESPLWLVSRGRTQHALKSLTYLHRKDVKAGSADQQLTKLLQENDRIGPGKRGSSVTRLLRALTKPTCYKPFILLTALFIFQQFTGIYVTIFYAVTFFESVGAAIDPYFSSVAIGVVRMVMGFTTSVLLTHFGRRPLFFLSCSGMGMFVIVSGYFTKEIAEGHMEKNVVPVICILLFMSLGVVGLLSIPWTMTAELFVTDIRGMAQGLMMAIANVLMFLVLKIYPFLDDMMGGAYAVQWMFGAVSLSAAVFIFIFVPETQGKELSEIQEYFEHNTVYILRKKDALTKTEDKEEGEEMVRLKETI